MQQGTITAVFWSGEGYLCDLKKRHCVFNNNNTEKNVKNICFDMKRERYHVASDINGCKCHCPHKGKGVANVENEYYKCKNGKNEKGDFYVPMFDCIDDCKGKKLQPTYPARAVSVVANLLLLKLLQQPSMLSLNCISLTLLPKSRLSKAWNDS